MLHKHKLRNILTTWSACILMLIVKFLLISCSRDPRTNDIETRVRASLGRGEEALLASFKTNPEYFSTASVVLPEDREFVLAAVKTNPWVLYYANPELCSDLEICLAAASSISRISDLTLYKDGQVKMKFEQVLDHRLWDVLENAIALFQSTKQDVRHALWCRGVRSSVRLRLDKIVQDTVIAAPGVHNAPVIHIYECAYQQNSHQYKVIFGNMGGKQYTVSIPADMTIEGLAKTLQGRWNQDIVHNEEVEFAYITYGDKKTISPLDGGLSIYGNL